MKNAVTLNLAESAFLKHLETRGSFDHYTGILSMNGYARLATETGDEAMLATAREHLMPYVRGERTFFANFPNYFCGGNGTAWMLYRGHLPEAAETVTHYAKEILYDAPRDSSGILCRPNRPGVQDVWIDIAFAVSPFLLFAGLHFERDEYLEEAFQQTAKLIELLRFDETGLIFQSKNLRRPGHMSQDHWSRGNGWAALALAELAVHLPESHPRRPAAVALFCDHVKACAAFQDEQGLWHQEMTAMKDAYVETSGSGLMLYALGKGIQAGLITESELERFKRGVQGLLAYISEDTDIYHTCRGCLCPGEGTKLEYMAVPPVVNDAHAFGPVILAMGQAHLLGITHI